MYDLETALKFIIAMTTLLISDRTAIAQSVARTIFILTTQSLHLFRLWSALSVMPYHVRYVVVPWIAPSSSSEVLFSVACVVTGITLFTMGAVKVSLPLSGWSLDHPLVGTGVFLAVDPARVWSGVASKSWLGSLLGTIDIVAAPKTWLLSTRGLVDAWRLSEALYAHMDRSIFWNRFERSARGFEIRSGNLRRGQTVCFIFCLDVINSLQKNSF